MTTFYHILFCNVYPASRSHSPEPNSWANFATILLGGDSPDSTTTIRSIRKSGTVPSRCSSFPLHSSRVTVTVNSDGNMCKKFFPLIPQLSAFRKRLLSVQISDKPLSIFFVENSQNYGTIAFNHIEHPVLVHPEPVII